MSRQLWLMATLLLACGGEESETITSLLPAGYPAGFATVRPCATSVEHGLVSVVIKTSSALVAAYTQGPFPFPQGAVVVKDEYDDSACMNRNGYTIMRKEPSGYDERFGNWHWQRLDRQGKVIVDGKLVPCASCHLRWKDTDFLGAAQN